MILSNHKTDPAITIVLATYNRPDVLRFSIKSVLLQTFTNWKLLVIGDKCNSPTGQVMNDFLSDERIKYINISKRSGSQALPNSAGIEVAKTKYISLLNHDDLWLPDHLEVALRCLEKNKKANYFIGRSIKVTGGHIDKDKFAITKEYTPADLHMKDAFSNKNLFEPASSWVFTKELADKTGPWKSSHEIFRTPLQDWTLRLWRAGAIMTSDPKVTCLKIQTHIQNKEIDKLYETSAFEHEKIFETLSKISPDEFRKLVGKDIIKNDNKAGRNNLQKRILNWLTETYFFSYLYYFTGFDIYSLASYLSRRKKGGIMDKLLLERTQEKLETFPSLDEIVEEISNKIDH